MTDLLDDLKAAATPPPLPKGITPGITYSGEQPVSVTTPWIEEHLETDEDYAEYMKSIGVPVPPGKRLELVEARFNQAAWHRDPQDRGRKDTAYTAPMWLYRFKVVDDVLGVNKADLGEMLKEARKKARKHKPIVRTSGVSQIINLADFQTGKTDVRGGTEELLFRSEIALKDVLSKVRQNKPEEIILVDNGDSTEGFESAPNADRTNDLQLTEQIRVWRRLFWRWITALADLGIPLKVISVPSNHCRVRRGKAGVGPNHDDWGLEVLAQVSDMAAQNPERFEHVEFIRPRSFDEHVTITLVGGKVVSFAHGHQVSRPDLAVPWAKGNSPRDVKISDIVILGHFHHFRQIAFGQRQWLFICPTMDAGASYFKPLTGEDSCPGVLTMTVDELGQIDVYVSWAE
jgi:hypothetical protein